MVMIKYLGFIVVSLFVLLGCSDDDLFFVEDYYALNSNDTFVGLVVEAPIPVENKVSIIEHPEEFLVSQLDLDTSGNVVYKYLPPQNFAGIQAVDIEVGTSSGGTDYVYSYLRFNIDVQPD